MKLKRPSFKSRKSVKKRKLRPSRKKIRKKATAAQKKRARIRKENIEATGERMELKPSQREGVDWLAANNHRGIIADSQGTGKTAMSLYALAENAHTLLPALVVCPASVTWNWRREAKQWIRCGVRVHVIEGMDDPFPKNIPHLTIVSWNTLHFRRNELIHHPYRTIIADEAHYAKNPESQRYKALSMIAKDKEFFWLLTATPLINRAHELGILKSLVGEPAPILRRFLSDVAPEVPPKSRVLLPVSMPESLQKEYDRAIEDFSGWLDDYLEKAIGGGLRAVEQAEKTMAAKHLAQVGYLRRILGRGKVPAVTAWVIGKVRQKESVVVYAEHRDVCNLFLEGLRKYKISHVRVDGSTTKMERQMAIDQFQEGSIKVFLGTRAAIEGINLYTARHLIFLERYFTPSHEEQAEDRIRRIGQTRETCIWYPFVENTYDERIRNIIEGKRGIVASCVGSEFISETEIQEVMTWWRRLAPIRKLVKPLHLEPMVSQRMPSLPDPRLVRGVLFGTGSWGMSLVLKSLRRRGFQILDTQTKEERVFVQTKSPAAFQRGSFQVVEIAPELSAIIGRPTNSDAERMRNYRRLY